jgi:hypothetical protein
MRDIYATTRDIVNRKTPKERRRQQQQQNDEINNRISLCRIHAPHRKLCLYIFTMLTIFVLLFCLSLSLLSCTSLLPCHAMFWLLTAKLGAAPLSPSLVISKLSARGIFLQIFSKQKKSPYYCVCVHLMIPCSRHNCKAKLLRP